MVFILTLIRERGKKIIGPVSGNHFIQQYRGTKLIWSGQVRVWDNRNGVHGRRNPYNSAKKGQWKKGDIIVGAINVSSIKHKGGRADGIYFNFNKEAWKKIIGPVGGNHFIKQYRGTKLIWSGQVRVWDNRNGVHGRRNLYNSAKKGQWKKGDIIVSATCTVP